MSHHRSLSIETRILVFVGYEQRNGRHHSDLLRHALVETTVIKKIIRISKVLLILHVQCIELDNINITI